MGGNRKCPINRWRFYNEISTHLFDCTQNDPPTYACVGENDNIASWRTMKNRLRNLEAAGIPTEFHKYPGLRHGFGLGTGTVAEGWIDDAVIFWENQRRPAGIP